MPYLKALLFSAIAAGVGCGVWVAIAQETGLQLALLALPIAAVVGAAAAFGAEDYANDLTGVMALLLAAGSVAGAVVLSQDAIVEARRARMIEEVRAFYPDFDREVMMSYVADQVVDEWAERGRRVRWPQHTDEETRGWYAEDYPEDVWAEARSRYATYSAADQDMIYEAFAEHHDGLIEEDVEFSLAMLEDESTQMSVTNRPRASSFSRRRGRIGLFGFGFWILAAGAAFGLGRGGFSD